MSQEKSEQNNAYLQEIRIALQNQDATGDKVEFGMEMGGLQ